MVWKDKPMQDLEGYFTNDQIERMIRVTKTPRNALLILLLWRSGRRISELLELKKADIDFDKGLVKWKILKKHRIFKNDKPEIVVEKMKAKAKSFKLKPLDSDTLSILWTYTQNLAPNHYLFPSPVNEGKHLTRYQAYNIIRRIAERAGIFQVGTRPAHPHNFRHSFAVHFLTQGTNTAASLKHLQSLLDHSSPQMTGHYLQFSQEDVRRELDNVFKVKKNKQEGEQDP